MVNEFTDQMKDTFEEARSVLVKAKDDMAHYYNQHQTPAPLFAPSNKVYLDSEDIQTTRPSKKLSHCQLGPYLIERHVGKYAYQLILPPSMRRMHPVFNVVKLTLAPDNPIPGRHRTPPPPPELVKGKEEYIVKEVLNSRLCSAEKYSTWSSGRAMGSNTTLGNIQNTSVMLQTRWLSSI